MTRELDAEVAEKVMGWRELELDQYGQPWGIAPTVWLNELVPCYSTSIAAAWSVVDHLVAQGAYVLVEGPANGVIHDGWRCVITPRRDLSAEVEAWGDTVMFAICLAALASVGQAVVR